MGDSDRRSEAVLMTEAFLSAFVALCARAERQVDVADEHLRFEFYDSLLEFEDLRMQLLECIALDPDTAMTTSVLASLLERVGAADRQVIVDASASGGGAFLTQRAAELAVFDELERGAKDKDSLQALLDGSDWLQRRVTERSESAVALQRLSVDGRTRRVRSRAAERLRSRRRG